VINVWLKGSDASQGSPIVMPILQSPAYIYPLYDNFPLLGNDPTVKFEPSGGLENTETTRFTRYVLLFGRPTATTLNVIVSVTGVGHIYERIGSATDTGYWYMYMKLSKTSDFTTFIDATSEKQVYQYTESISSLTDTWKDVGTIYGQIASKVTLNAGEYLLLVLRGSSKNNSNIATTSIGINSTNFKVYPTIFI
jgi:hypothetical protein